MKKFILLSAGLLLTVTLFAGCNNASSKNADEKSNPDETTVRIASKKSSTKIQVAILLDTSGSMEGLIEQAKSRLWNIVNTLTTLKFEGEAPAIEIALYEYGSYRIKNSDYIRQVTPLTTDLDMISEDLFGLTTGGSEEYCGAVISQSVKSLEWGNNESDMKLIYIAGNEVFTQGKVPYKEAIQNALKKGIYVNTIHCGSSEVGIRDLWRDAAIRGKGKFFNIDSNAKIRYIVTPYDDRISHYNMKLNDTYVSYGRLGFEKKANQTKQDTNAMSISKSNYTERAVSKSKSAYKNSSWDLVDKIKTDKNILSEIRSDELPSELQGKSKAEIESILSQKEKERTTIQKEINDLAQKRQEYIDNELQKESTSDDLGYAITQSVLDFAKEKGYTIEYN